MAPGVVAGRWGEVADGCVGTMLAVAALLPTGWVERGAVEVFVDAEADSTGAVLCAAAVVGGGEVVVVTAGAAPWDDS